MGAGQNVGGGVRLHMGQGGGDQGGHSVQPDNTTLKMGTIRSYNVSKRKIGIHH